MDNNMEVIARVGRAALAVLFILAEVLFLETFEDCGKIKIFILEEIYENKMIN